MGPLFESFTCDHVDHLMTISLMTTFSDRMQYVNTLLAGGYLFDFEDQPEAWVQRLVVAPDSNPIQIAAFVDAAFGRSFICQELSALYGCNITLIDALKMFLYRVEHRDAHRLETIRACLLMLITYINFKRTRIRPKKSTMRGL
jgi:hypothetical protein